MKSNTWSSVAYLEVQVLGFAGYPPIELAWLTMALSRPLKEDLVERFLFLRLSPSLCVLIAFGSPRYDLRGWLGVRNTLSIYLQAIDGVMSLALCPQVKYVMSCHVQEYLYSAWPQISPSEAQNTIIHLLSKNVSSSSTFQIFLDASVTPKTLNIMYKDLWLHSDKSWHIVTVSLYCVA